MSQPTGQKTGGSTFMNGKDFKAWKLIDNSDCRGLKNGDAIIPGDSQFCTDLKRIAHQNERKIHLFGKKKKMSLSNK